MATKKKTAAPKVTVSIDPSFLNDVVAKAVAEAIKITKRDIDHIVEEEVGDLMYTELRAEIASAACKAIKEAMIK